MLMLCVSRRTNDNYFKAGKLKPVRINKRNHFAVTEAQSQVHVPEIPKIRSYQDDLQSMLKQVAQMNEMGEDW